MYTLVTGATGFIAQELLKNDQKFICVTRKKKEVIRHPTFKINNFDGNTNWKGAFENVSSIIHLAGIAHSNEFSEKEYQSVNTEGTLKLAIEAAKFGVRRFIFISSIGVNGLTSGQTPFTPEMKPNPHNTYAKTKLDAENGLKRISSLTGMEIVIIRPPLVYGKNSPGNFGSLLKLINSVPLLPFGAVKNKKSFIYIKNLTDFILKCRSHPNAANRTFLPSDGKSISTKDFCKALSEGLSYTSLQIPVPTNILRLLLKIINKKGLPAQLLDNLEVDTEHTLKLLNWTPRFSLEESIHDIKEQMGR